MSPLASAERSGSPSGLGRQAERLAEFLSRGGSHLHAVILGGMRQGKSHLLRCIHGLLFKRGEGPVPILYTFEQGHPEAYTARHFAASLCQQCRAFLMRQQELLQEPLISLEQELERPGLPLSLAELGGELLRLEEAGQPKFAAALAQQFLHREARPLCLLLDDGHALDENSPFLRGLGRLSSPWLLAGRRAFLAGLAAVHCWPVAPLELPTAQEALDLAERRCRELEVRSSRQAWEDWLHYAGTSLAWIEMLAVAAALAGDDLESTAALARLYARELVGGSIGNWLAGRWERAVPQDSASPRLGETLAAMAETSTSVSGISLMTGIAPGQVPGLIAEDWLEQTAAGVLPRLGRVETDWLRLVAGAPAAPLIHLARARAEQAFFGRLASRHAEEAEELRKLAEGLRQCVQPTVPSVVAARERQPPGSLPAICSVAVERAPRSELLWCYGFRSSGHAQSPEACILLVALCAEEPSAAEVKQWEQAVQSQAAELPGQTKFSAPAKFSAEDHKTKSHGARGELWLALPPGASLVPAGEERRMRWENLSQLLERSRGSQVSRMREDPACRAAGKLETRQSWLEEELGAVRVQPARQPTLAREKIEPAHAHSYPDWRATATVGLLLMSADLLAAQQQGSPAENPDRLAALREIQVQSQRLVELLQALEGAPDAELSKPLSHSG